MMNPDKQQFLQEELVARLRTLKGNETGLWGKMNAWQMVEHLADAIRLAYGQYSLPMVTKGEMLEKMQAFALSDKPFRENTENPFMDPNPIPTRSESYAAALEFLERHIAGFFQHFEQHPQATYNNPFFGELNGEGQLHLVAKHASHHLRQFGLPHQW